MASPILRTLFIFALTLVLVVSVQARFHGAKACIKQNGVDATFTFFHPHAKKFSHGARVRVNVRSGLTNVTDQYGYHIHQFPITGTDCLTAGAHLDPKKVGGPTYVCDPKQPKLCEEGDLSGKFGKLQGSESGAAKVSYHDRTLRWSGYDSILGRSVVIHRADGSRLACANMVPF